MINKSLGKLFFILGLIMCNISAIIAQEINLDSLLNKTIESIRAEDYQKAILQSRKGISLAPDYLDFRIFLGRAYQMTQQKDSARYQLNYVIDHNTNYESSFIYLLNLELEDQRYKDAMLVVDKAISAHPDNRMFYGKKLQIYQLQNDDKGEKEYLQELLIKYPNDSELQQRKLILETKSKSDRFGINYTFTSISRDEVGPWHLGSLQFIRERSWGSLIGRLNYAERLSNGESVVNGIQYELASYFFMGKKKLNYSNAGISFSSDDAFPELRLNYSYYHNYRKGWESEIGVRYTRNNNQNIVSGVLGLGKYLGSYWINLRSYIQEQESNWYPALTLTARYYMNSRFDYFTLITGYGSSPDERSIQGQIDQRLTLNSYRFGAGYYRLLNDRFITGLQAVYNNQEYIDKQRQDEFEIFLTLQYKF
ncbi:YaiO family outer membrane beta-barrel protein [Zhouia amylolytica]|uniref:YaiO beta-barrel domain-containing protein n=1 Tax=Zhouia amylolytica AD3 TaxID=1286632 RepID=W2UQZ5_9FLAO|nr:YaiO family outer membrane beta-barrel protein [Zhouia amylolytica]ETN95896.1 hypothetical protein P278_16180 [Zhouia amylolytica AD3]